MDETEFGLPEDCKTSADAIALLERSSDAIVRRRSAAFALAMHARQSLGIGSFHSDSQSLLDELSKIKSQIDRSSGHDLEIVDMTARILRAAQNFMVKNTVSVTEWPTPKEITDLVRDEAGKEVPSVGTAHNEGS